MNNRFENQNPNKDQLNKEEDTAKLIKNGGKVVGGILVAGAAIKKYGPKALTAIKSLIK